MKTTWERLEPKIRYDNGCWTVGGYINRIGYPTVRIGGRSGTRMNAHRAMYMAEVGAIPHGHDIDHLCRNKACVNPLHLEAVPHAENLRRGGHWWERGFTSPRLRPKDPR